MKHVHGRLPSQTAALRSSRAAVLCAATSLVASLLVAAGCSSNQSSASADPYASSGASPTGYSYPRSCIGPAYSADAAYSTIGGFQDPRVVPSNQMIAAQQAQIAQMQSQAYAQARAQMLQQSQAIDSTQSADYAAYLAWKRAQGYQ
ncbi:MAG: hypothetical protein JNM94_01925 [Phycisphaerae bacterium]|nr:hypothetical protein [Phycisphaerae bacterium]